ncbi:unnamed protein product [Lota lota]
MLGLVVAEQDIGWMDWDRERPLSPESTVTTLMSCSGHLPPTHQTIRCGDQEFASASAALDAYIADFELWRLAPGALARSTGPRLDLLPPGTSSSQPGCPRPPGTLRNRDVLKELLTDTELCFLSLPAITSLRCHADGDEVALTTEELLAIPSDGSLPVTKTTAYLTDLRHRSLCRSSNSLSPQPGVSCHSCGPLGGARDRSHAPSPTTIKWRGEDIDRKCLSRQEVTRLQNSQTAGPVIGADCLSSSHLSDSSQYLDSAYYCHSYQPPGHAHSVKSSHLQSQSHILRSHHSLNLIGDVQFGHAYQQQPMDGQLAASPSGFWEKAGLIPPRAPSWLDQLPGEDGQEEEEEELLSVSLLTDCTPAVNQEAVSEHRLLLANTGHAPIGYTHTGHTPRMLIDL